MAITPTPSSAGLRVLTVGTGKTYATFAAFLAYVKTQNPKSNSEKIRGEYYDSLCTLTGQDIQMPGGTCDNSYYVEFAPVPGNDQAYDGDTNPVAFSNSGAVLTFTSDSPSGMQTGFRFIGWNIKFIGSSTATPLTVQYDFNEFKSRFSKCRILVDMPGPYAMDIGQNYGKFFFEDNLILFAANRTGALFFSNAGEIYEERNTYTRLGVAGYVGLQGRGGYIRNNVYTNMGNAAYSAYTNEAINNNFSDNAADTRSGFTISTATAMFAGASDFRPKTGGPLIAAAGSSAYGTTDLFARARGTSPNAGAIQREYVAGAPMGTVTNQPDPDGQSLGPVTFNVSGSPTSATIVATPSTTNPDGAQLTTGTVVLGSGNTTGSGQITNLPPGRYDLTIKATNASGDGIITGTHGFVIVGASGNPQAPDPGASSSTVTGVVVTPDGATVQGGATQQFSATVQGTNSPAQTVTWSVASGVGSINSGTGLYTAPVATNAIQTAVVRARSVQNGDVFDDVTVSIPVDTSMPNPVVTGITITPANATVNGAATRQFAANVQGTNSPSQSVTWSKLSGVGSISSAGLYTAPPSTSSAQAASIRATSVQDGSFFSDASITIPAVTTGFNVQVTIPLTYPNGLPAANLTGLRWAWHDQPSPENWLTPTDKGSAETTSSNGTCVILLPNSAKTESGQTGHIYITNAIGDMVFAGEWAVD